MKPQTLPALLAPYNRAFVAKTIGVHRNTIDEWFHDRMSPSDELLPALSDFLRVPVIELAEIVANDRKRRSLEKFAETA